MGGLSIISVDILGGGILKLLLKTAAKITGIIKANQNRNLSYIILVVVIIVERLFSGAHYG